MRAAEDTCSPAAAGLAAGRRFGRALLKAVGAALLVAMVPLQGYAQNAARPNGLAAPYRASHLGDRHPRNHRGPFSAPPSGLLTGACGLKGTARQRANAEQRCLSAAFAYVVSPPPATRGVLPRYLPSISPKDAQPIPPVAAAAPLARPAWQAGRVRRSQAHRYCRPQGARRLLAELPRQLHAQRGGSCRQERSARRLRLHRHRLCPRRCRGGPGAMAPHHRPTPPQAAKAHHLGRGQHRCGRLHDLSDPARIKPHSTNPIERLNCETKRRTELVGIFLNGDAIVRVVDTVQLEQNDEWAVQRPRN